MPVAVRHASVTSHRRKAMPWVPTVPEEQAAGAFADLYRRARERAGKVPNIAKVQSLRPETAARGFDLYCQLMDAPTGLTRRERVLIATVVSKVNGCLY
jgi:alkylhydroperoxidase family enzyme